jgi:hypothetical protein
MNLKIDFTPELTNTRFAPLAVLLALYQDKKLLEPLQQSADSDAKSLF